LGGKTHHKKKKNRGGKKKKKKGRPRKNFGVRGRE